MLINVCSLGFLSKYPKSIIQIYYVFGEEEDRRSLMRLITNNNCMLLITKTGRRKRFG
ncbi:hypothetical protein IC575_002415 [Cucumis melo]